MRILLLSNEYPPHIYGGAGVHVDHLCRELMRAAGDQHRLQVLAACRAGVPTASAREFA